MLFIFSFPVGNARNLIYFYSMQIRAIIDVLEQLAPLSLQEDYDNAGLQVGDPNEACSGVMVALDATEAVVAEAADKGCNLLVVHHPLIFGGIKKLTGSNQVERTLLAAIHRKVAIYAIHTNLDHVSDGVNAAIAAKLQLQNCRILQPKTGLLKKLSTYVPLAHTETVRSALFAAGAGHIGAYDECSFAVEGNGSFRGAADTNPFVGKPGQRHIEREEKLEIIFPAWLERKVLTALWAAHPYEEVAYEITPTDNVHQHIGAGMIGELEQGLEAAQFLQLIKNQFNTSLIRHSVPAQKPIQKVAICGGAGIFLLHQAMAAGADALVTSDIKYHSFFEAEPGFLLCDIGHWESEQYTIDLLADHIARKFPNFAVLKTGVRTNPVHYFS